ncbi:hypothetical protein GWK47_026418 [Chionoecetes opilio]|uniref:Uncharacterized protein n=1 Tax=Chionoecetes opilio TaxID=41210 RepID=A0A8J8WE44_CHIOP|nr:hypothetical protein GWK47_026418 [Chionoecetes opilio]
MGCRSRKGAGCYSFTCCCCVEGEEACWWIGAVSGAWCAVATLVDFISASPATTITATPASTTASVKSKLSLVAGSINIGQCLTSVLLLHGARKESKRVLVPWLLWCVASLVMMVVWVVVTAPHMPSLRGILSLFQLAWGIHFFLVVRTQYSRLALKLAPPEAAPLTVPPNTPARRHRRWRRR